MRASKFQKRFGTDAKILWQDRKRWCGQPWSFTRYYIVEKPNVWVKLICSTGLLSVIEEEIQFYRIFDISVFQSLSNKIFGVGTLTLYCSDDSNPEVRLVRVKDPYILKDKIAERVELERSNRRVSISEFSSSASRRTR